jgi:hypothetical protein
VRSIPQRWNTSEIFAAVSLAKMTSGFEINSLRASL